MEHIDNYNTNSEKKDYNYYYNLIKNEENLDPYKEEILTKLLVDHRYYTDYNRIKEVIWEKIKTEREKVLSVLKTNL